MKLVAVEPTDGDCELATDGDDTPSKEKEKSINEEDGVSRAVVFGVLLYAACSSTLLVFNKVAMHLVHDAPFVLFCQFVSSCLTVKVLACAQPDEDIEGLKAEKVKPFAMAALLYYLCLLSNTQAMNYVNVETVIVVRSCSPIAVALLETATFGRALPSVQGILALLAISGGAMLYVAADAGFQITGYAWLMMYFVFIVVEMVYVKFIISSVKMSTWTRVYYNNVLSLPMAVVSAFALGASPALNLKWSMDKVAVVGLSCVAGVAISYAGFNLRNLVSATSFTVCGVVCKILSVLINDLIWTEHSNAIGHVGLLICIASGFVYEKVKTRTT